MGKRPNLLFIFADQHRKFDLGCYGNPQVMTPNLDALAQEGMRFTGCCSNSPVCVPARGSLLTGLHAAHHGALTNDLAVRYDIESIADVLNAGGYHTGYIGKWHLCGVPRRQTIEKERRLGFAAWKVANCNHNYLDCWYDDEDGVRHPVQGYEPEIFGGLAADFLAENAGAQQPFALFLSFATPHDPHDKVGAEYMEMYREREVTLRPNAPESIMVNREQYITHAEQVERMRGYYAHITAIDRQVGVLTELLRQKGVLDDTLIVYTADHGDMLGSHGQRDKQLPHEESIGVPLLMRWPGSIATGVNHGLIGLVDLPVTVAGLLGLSFSAQTDGVDLSGMALRGGDGLAECYIYDLYACHQAADKGQEAWRGIRTGRYTYVTHGDGTEWLLFDNEKDPYQMKNLAGDPALEPLRKELFERLRTHVESTDAFLNGDDYMRFCGRAKDFNESQIYFRRAPIAED